MDLDKLQYCEVMGRTLLFHRQDGVVLDSAGRLDDLCEHLKDYDCFIRCHSSYLVNLKTIICIRRTSVTLDTGAEIPVARGKYDDINRAFIAGN